MRVRVELNCCCDPEARLFGFVRVLHELFVFTDEAVVVVVQVQSFSQFVVKLAVIKAQNNFNDEL